MRVNFQSITPDAERNIVEIARVSSSRKDKKEDYEKLVRYLIDHGHWSPFEHSFMTLEIETSKAIAIQLIRHRSFTFQEFSQRYQDVSSIDSNMFEDVVLRKQAESNRQSSIEDIEESSQLYTLLKTHLSEAEFLYRTMIMSGVSRETARMVLPLCTKTKIYMTGSIRSWIHFFSVRDDQHAQKEIQDIAKKAKRIFSHQLPVVAAAMKYT
jgi:thymidylate synthase (FAD)